MQDLPVTDVVRHHASGDLYASSDFGVMRLPSGSRTWVEASRGMPEVEVAGLTMEHNGRYLYAATHGRGAYRLALTG
jgi:hypothetical protein